MNQKPTGEGEGKKGAGFCVFPFPPVSFGSFGGEEKRKININDAKKVQAE